MPSYLVMPLIVGQPGYQSARQHILSSSQMHTRFDHTINFSVMHFFIKHTQITYFNNLPFFVWYIYGRAPLVQL